MPLSKTKIRHDFSRAAENYEKYADIQRGVAERLAKFGWEIFKPDGLILDVGSGTGFIKQVLKPANIIQVDMSDIMCQKSAHLAPTIQGDMESLPIKYNSLDGIISSLTLQWATDTTAVFKEFYKALKPGAPFMISTFGSHTLQELKSVFRMVDPFVHVNKFLEPEDLYKRADYAGFINLDVKTELEIREYSDVMQLMNNMKKIGASNKQSGRKQGLSSREYFKQLDQIYKKNFGRNTFIPATWEVLYMKGVKP